MGTARTATKRPEPVLRHQAPQTASGGQLDDARWAARTRAAAAIAGAALTADAVLSLQQTAGNCAVQRLIASRRQPGRPEGGAAGPEAPGVHATPAVQRRILPAARNALETAGRLDPKYQNAIPGVNRLMSEDAQTKLMNVESTGAKVSKFFGNLGAKISGRADPAAEQRADLVKLLRAYLLSELGTRLVAVDQRNPTDAERKQSEARYLAKALEVRDKQAPLLEKGVAAPETRAFLEAAGLAGGITVSEEQGAQELAKGPRIDVRSTFIGGPVLGIKLRGHLFIVYTSSEGRQTYVRGGPGSPVAGAAHGYTTVDVGAYAPGTVDWDPSAPSKTVSKGEAAKDKLDSMIEAASAVNEMKVPYQGHFTMKANLKSARSPLTGENCNAAAWTVLDRAGVPKSKPTGLHPGWGHVLGSDAGTGTAMPAPEQDDEAAPGHLSGDPTTVFSDRSLQERLEDVPKLTEVTVVKIFGKGATARYKIAYEHNGEQKTGWVSQSDVRSLTLYGRDHPVPLPAPPKPPPTPDALSPADYPAGRHQLAPVVKAPLKLRVANSEDGPTDVDLDIPADLSGVFARVLVLDDMTRQHGRGQLQYSGKVYYVPLEQLAPLFGWGGAKAPDEAPPPQLDHPGGDQAPKGGDGGPGEGHGETPLEEGGRGERPAEERARAILQLVQGPLKDRVVELPTRLVDERGVEGGRGHIKAGLQVLIVGTVDGQLVRVDGSDRSTIWVSTEQLRKALGSVLPELEEA